MDYSEKWGDSIEAAVKLALIDLKLTEDQVNVIVLEEPSKGFLGIGSKLAKVRVEKKPELIEKKEEKVAKTPEKEDIPGRFAPAPSKNKYDFRRETKKKEKTTENADTRREYRNNYKNRNERNDFGGRRANVNERNNFNERNERNNFNERNERGNFNERNERGNFNERNERTNFNERNERGNFNERNERTNFNERNERVSFNTYRSRNFRNNRGERKKYWEQKEREPRFPRSEQNIPRRERPLDLVETTDHPVYLFLQEISKNMDLSLEIKASMNSENVYIDITGKDSGSMIGKRGQTLDAIQYLCSLVANKNSESYVRVVIDAENYRMKRERTLARLAIRLSDKVKKTGKSVRLEPMNPYERKIIHSTLQNRYGVTTRSEGEEPYRRVIIEPVK